jgi:hypothetical protein
MEAKPPTKNVARWQFVLTRYLAHVLEVDAINAIQIPNLVSRFVHKQPQFGLRRDPESSKSFQEPQSIANCRTI